MLRLCETTMVPIDAGFRVELDGIGPLAVFRHEDAFYVTADQCTHGEASLSEGEVFGEEVECPYHQGAFNFRTGVATVRPCVVALKTYPVTVVDGVIFITV